MHINMTYIMHINMTTNKIPASMTSQAISQRACNKILVTGFADNIKQIKYLPKVTLYIDTKINTNNYL